MTDIICLVGLSHLPTYNLLQNFYGTRPTTIITVASITTVSVAVPFTYFRRKAAATSASSGPKSSVLQDKPTAIYTTLLATLTYTLSLYASFVTWLPAFLVSHFDGLPDISVVHGGPRGFVSMSLRLLLAGYAVRVFIFRGSAGESRTRESANKYTERQGEFLVKSLYRKYWVPLAANTKALVQRTAVLSLMIFLNTVVQVVGTINGAEVSGALGWGGLWTAATVAIGAIFWWIEAV